MTISLVSSEPGAKGVKVDEQVKTVRGTTLLKRGFAHMQKHGVVMDVTNVEQAQIAEEAGAVAVMVLDKLPYDVRKAGGVARTASIKVIEEIISTVWIGHLDILVLLSRHFGTAQTLIDIERPNASGELLATDDHPDEREKIYAVASQLDWFVKSGMRHCKTGHFVFRRSLTSLIPSFRA